MAFLQLEKSPYYYIRIKHTESGKAQKKATGFVCLKGFRGKVKVSSIEMAKDPAYKKAQNLETYLKDTYAECVASGMFTKYSEALKSHFGIQELLTPQEKKGKEVSWDDFVREVMIKKRNSGRWTKEDVEAVLEGRAVQKTLTKIREQELGKNLKYPKSNPEIVKFIEQYTHGRGILENG